VAGKQVKVSVVADTKKFQAAFRGLARETGISGFTTRMKNAAATVAKAGAAIGAAGAAIGVKVLAMGADLEQSQGAIQDVFKGAAGQMQDLASQAVTSVGLSGNAYNELATIIGSQLKNAGTPMDQLAGKTNDLITTGADLAAMFGGSTQDAVNALSSALKGERDPIERYGVSLKQSAIDAKAAELGYSKVGGSFDQTAQAAATLALITEQTSDATGKFAREGDTMSHQVQVWKAKIQDFGEKIGAKLLPPLTEFASKAADKVFPALDQLGAWMSNVGIPAVQQFAATFADEWIPRIQEAATWVGDKIVPRLQDFASLLTGTVIPGMVQVGTWLKDNASNLAPFAAAILVLVGAWKAYNMVLQVMKVYQIAATAAQAAWNIVAAANPIGIVIVLVVAVVAAIATFIATHEGARAKATEIWNGIRSGIGDAVNKIVAFVQNLGQIPGKVGAWFQNAKNQAKAKWDGLVSDARALPGRVVAALAALGSQLKAATLRHFLQMVAAAKQKGDELTSFVRSIPSKITGALGNLGSLLRQAGLNVIQGFLDGINEKFASVKATLSNLTSLLPDWKGPASRDRTILRRPGQLIMAGFVDALRDAYGDVQQAMAGVTATVETGLNPTLATLGSPVSSTRYQGATINVYALTPTVEVGRVVADALARYESMNGAGR
jgi:phage-related protein